MDWNYTDEHEIIIKALEEAYPEYNEWVADAGYYWPRNYYFNNGNHIGVTEGTTSGSTNDDSRAITYFGGRGCGKSWLSDQLYYAQKYEDEPQKIHPAEPTVSFDDLYGGQDDTV